MDSNAGDKNYAEKLGNLTQWSLHTFHTLAEQLLAGPATPEGTDRKLFILALALGMQSAAVLHLVRHTRPEGLAEMKEQLEENMRSAFRAAELTKITVEAGSLEELLASLPEEFREEAAKIFSGTDFADKDGSIN